MRRTSSTLTLAALLGFGFASVASAQARTFEIRNDGGSRIQFISDAPLETITGVSTHVTGSLTVDTNNLATARGNVAVRVDSIRTGIDLRDQHLRAENWLNAAAHPNATFEITRIEGATRLEPNRAANVRLHGRFSIHGRTHEIVANARVRLIPVTDEMRENHVTGDTIRAQASFRVLLTDYDVSVPAVVRLKVANEIRVNVTIRAVVPSAS
jgi:polyisoprenoid-binding protein YceI